ncbi:MAG: barstar family protein [Sphingomonas sp.]
MREIVIDCAGITSPDEFWQRYIDRAKPEGASIFGRNLDAFWDAIEGGGPGWPGEVALIFTHSHQLSALRTGDGHDSFLEALRNIASKATGVTITFS